MTQTDIRPTGGSPDWAPEPDKRGLNLSALFALLMGAVALLVVPIVALAAISIFRDDDGGGASAVAQASRLEYELNEFSIEGPLMVPAGIVDLDVKNVGSIEHNLIVRELDKGTANLGSGASESVPLGAMSPGTYELYCDIAGHADSGMRAELVVAEPGQAVAPAIGESEGEAEGEEFDADILDKVMTDSMLKYPSPTGVMGNQPLEPTILADGTKQFELTAAITKWEREPGDFVDAWTYNGVVPGPEIRVDVGDKIQVILHNETPLGTDIHWHGIHTPNDQDGVAPYTQQPIKSGETFTYEFDAVDPAIGMYHAHLHSQTSVINGMFGAFIIGDTPIPAGQTISGIEIPADFEAAIEMPMVLNDAGVIGLTLNGKSFPATDPIVMKEGEWGIIHYYNEGLGAHPMHLHQFPQLIFAKDGYPLEQPYWADTINVAAGERYSVLFQADTKGTWVYHCHILTHAERETGMFGMVTAVIVD